MSALIFHDYARTALDGKVQALNQAVNNRVIYPATSQNVLISEDPDVYEKQQLPFTYVPEGKGYMDAFHTTTDGVPVIWPPVKAFSDEVDCAMICVIQWNGTSAIQGMKPDSFSTTDNGVSAHVRFSPAGPADTSIQIGCTRDNQLLNPDINGRRNAGIFDGTEKAANDAILNLSQGQVTPPLGYFPTSTTDQINWKPWADDTIPDFVEGERYWVAVRFVKNSYQMEAIASWDDTVKTVTFNSSGSLDYVPVLGPRNLNTEYVATQFYAFDSLTGGWELEAKTVAEGLVLDASDAGSWGINETSPHIQTQPAVVAPTGANTGRVWEHDRLVILNLEGLENLDVTDVAGIGVVDGGVAKAILANSSDLATATLQNEQSIWKWGEGLSITGVAEDPFFKFRTAKELAFVVDSENFPTLYGTYLHVIDSAGNTSHIIQTNDTYYLGGKIMSDTLVQTTNILNAATGGPVGTGYRGGAGGESLTGTTSIQGQPIVNLFDGDAAFGGIYIDIAVADSTGLDEEWWDYCVVTDITTTPALLNTIYREPDFVFSEGINGGWRDSSGSNLIGMVGGNDYQFEFFKSGEVNPGTLTTPYSIGTNNGPLFAIKTSDTLATIEAAGFFDGNAAYASLLKTGDVVLIEASNGTKFYNVTVEKISRTITLSAGTEIQ